MLRAGWRPAQAEASRLAEQAVGIPARQAAAQPVGQAVVAPVGQLVVAVAVGAEVEAD